MNLLLVGMVVARTAREGATPMAMALKGGRNIGTATESFTPLHTTGLEMANAVFDLVVWGTPPPKQTGLDCPASSNRRAQYAPQL
jgi:hypothetical protein